jgi:hypothetical protein
MEEEARGAKLHHRDLEMPNYEMEKQAQDSLSLIQWFRRS